MKTRLLLAVAALLALASSSCRPKGECDVGKFYREDAGDCAVCGPVTCPGCCDFAGQCQLGSSPSVCGANGNACIACVSGMCMAGYGCECSGNPGPEDGCCDAKTGTFQPGTSDDLCGGIISCDFYTYPPLCQDCTASGQTCTSSAFPCMAGLGAGTSFACTPAPPMDGGTDGGAPDAGAVDAGTDAGVDSGVDAGLDAGFDGGQDAGPCSLTTCPSGCCDSSNTCQPGTLDTVCGEMGGSCTNCQSTAETCVAAAPYGGFCATSLPDGGSDAGCGPGNCTGCCAPNGRCTPGMSVSACGLGGVMCKQCSGTGAMCVDGGCT